MSWAITFTVVELKYPFEFTCSLCPETVASIDLDVHAKSHGLSMSSAWVCYSRSGER
jgi:hypothetical protein